ncbi:MAG TPA: orotidine 5'-phosphate decarboxylase [Candidatus Bathyarchaeia archaeon]|nr:orotidine 5'-phosphate decarboxylase [Candidatus Bathyarchaeia archaeon]
MRNNGQEPFRERILETSRSNDSRIIVAIDLHNGRPSYIGKRALSLVEKTHRSICGVKFGRQTVLSLGPRQTASLLRKIHDYRLPTIIDDKLNDIDETNEAITRTYHDLGFDALTVNPFAGWKGGLQTAFRFAHDHGMGVIALVYMSHPGASEGYGQKISIDSSGKTRLQFEVFAKKAVDWRADGAIVGATRPDIVRRAKEILGDKVLIFSPGIGAQGGDVRRSLKAGTDYFIIGRSITNAKIPANAARRFANASVALDN